MLEKDKWYCCSIFTNYKSPLICLFIQQLFIEPLLCARQAQRCWRMGEGWDWPGFCQYLCDSQEIPGRKTGWNWSPILQMARQTQRREIISHAAAQLASGGVRICTRVCKIALMISLTFTVLLQGASICLGHFNMLMTTLLSWYFVSILFLFF